MRLSGRVFLILTNGFLAVTGGYHTGSVGAEFLRGQVLSLPEPQIKTPALSQVSLPEDPGQSQNQFVAVLEHNIFKAQRPVIETPEPLLEPESTETPIQEEAVVLEEQSEESSVPQERPLTKLALLLAGTMIYDHDAFAFIGPKQQPLDYTVYQIGDCFDPNTAKPYQAPPSEGITDIVLCPEDKVKLFEIEDRQVLIFYQGQEEILSMDQNELEKARDKVLATLPVKRTPPPVQPAQPPEQNVRLIPLPTPEKKPLIISGQNQEEVGIPDDGKREFHFERAWVDEQLANFNELLTDARVIPTTRDGKAMFMFEMIREGSVYQKLGLKNKDIILEINGFIVDNVPKALKLFEALQSEREITLKVERKEQPTVFNYYID